MFKPSDCDKFLNDSGDDVLKRLGLSNSVLPMKENVVNGVIKEGQVGNYALGEIFLDEFNVQYVGRSDTDLRQRLIRHIENGEHYEFFAWKYAKTRKEAFEKECRNYHDFGGDKKELDNKNHPDKPDGTDYKCLVCGC